MVTVTPSYLKLEDTVYEHLAHTIIVSVSLKSQVSVGLGGGGGGGGGGGSLASATPPHVCCYHMIDYP